MMSRSPEENEGDEAISGIAMRQFIYPASNSNLIAPWYFQDQAVENYNRVQQHSN